MSIWCSQETIGEDELDTPNGHVRAYAAGWSNHYPSEDVEAPATLNLATIPTWCVPGHSEEYYEVIGPWLRLDLDSPNALTWWRKDAEGNPVPEPVHGSVVLDEVAVRQLRDQLTDWLDADKVHPVVDS